MQPELEQLLILQDRDQKIKQIQSEVRTLPQQRAHLDSQLKASAAALDGAKHKAQQVEVEKKRLELDVGTRETSIARLRTQQYETRKNDEFRAIGNEIERYQKEIQAIEDQELELMEQADKLKVEVSEAEKQAAAARDSVARQMADLESKAKALDDRLRALKDERAQIASRVDEDVLDRFQRLFVSKGDAAVVGLRHEVCTGCHMKLTPQTVHRVKAERELVSCEQCGRILYWED
ncbi:MAG TPA: C4-type zinc ribbon domain-containing protein [Chthoniobacterales bacterium]|nr:C4-type zinc ribbon domain-containing protein [Chthoniobacterales bacterium]